MYNELRDCQYFVGPHTWKGLEGQETIRRGEKLRWLCPFGCHEAYLEMSLCTQKFNLIILKALTG